MARSESGTHAWLVCADILGKIKTELITQAMDTVREIMDSKMIDVKGSLINLPDKPSDTELYMFLINKILEERDNMASRYGGYLEESAGRESTPESVRQAERIRRFLLSVEKIHLLMHYNDMLEEWMRDVAMQVKPTDPSEVIRSTMRDDASRRELIGYVLRNQTMVSERILSKSERNVLKSSLEN